MLRDGFRFPWDTKPAPYHGDNYESAVGCPKVMAEFARLEELGYISGPFEEHEVEVINPLSSVPKKGTDKMRVVVDITASGVNPTITAPRLFRATDGGRRGCRLLRGLLLHHH